MRWISFAFFNVWRNGRRSLFTILVAAVAVAAILTTSGFALFTYQSLAEKAARDEGNFIITHQQFLKEEEDMPLQYGLEDTETLIEQLSSDEDIKSVLPRINFNGLVSNGEKSSIFIGLGVEPDEFMVKGPFLTMLEGKALSNFGNEDEAEVVLGKELARNLKVQVGDYITLMSTTTDGALNAFDFTVRGIYTTGVPDLDKRQLYVKLSDAQSLLYTEKVSSLSVYLFDINKTEQKVSDYQKRDQSLQFTPWWERAFYYQSVKDLYNRIFGLLGGIMVLLVFFSISNTMAMTVTERTREIGTVSAMGSYQWEIIRNFVLESSIIGFIGASLGIIASAFIAWGLVYVGLEMPPPPGSNKGYPLTITFSWEIAGIVLFTMVLVCVLAALKAAHKGSSKSITEALSHV
ncbi:ABC transporter permease [Pseudoalteromonas phenolica]|uniref:Lipoprotein-releasing system permease protein n=1 Tax=Pseudoalteromonas phenolica TaxID=161398 RepID=A0A0S2K708_9GAMM|nr:FtsX-like permease family protein [Pseudoalteromonas phenolica]ALO43828.1 Lipoprotein-releasing system permease protein [Pseudoalteromonas phenolica]MBE0354994.1 putative ABC transport system permease protein [Pseudoalteromonas phenolica O-BC30]RXE92461.1 ABC transporter permease [Pseudoalteromonas phenolica O-BC30]